MRNVIISAAGLVLAASCTGAIGEGRAPDPDNGGAAAAKGLPGTALAGKSAFRLLTVREYDNALANLLGDTTHPSTGVQYLRLYRLGGCRGAGCITGHTSCTWGYT